MGVISAISPCLMISANIELPLLLSLCMSLLSLSLLPPQGKKKKKSPFSAVDTCVSSCLVRISNWDIHPVRASKLANPRAPLPCKGRASQARSGRRAAPVVPRVPGIPAILGSLRLQHSWAQEEGSCCATEGKWEAIYFKGFHALLQKTG